MDALDKTKAFLIRGDDLERMQRLLAEWETLTVHQTDAQTPSLTRGTLATRLEIPKATAIDADHPFRVIDASDGTGPKVRVLPGICNFSFPTVGGFANDITEAEDHAANAPRLAITETCFVAIIPDGIEGPLPATLDIGTITSPAATPAGVPLAKVTLADGAITGIYQLVFDIVGIAALDYGPAFGVSYAVTR